MDKNRRQFFKYVLAASGVLVLGKLLSMKLARPSASALTDGNTRDAFKVVSDKNKMVIYDRSGEEVLIIDNGKED